MSTPKVLVIGIGTPDAGCCAIGSPAAGDDAVGPRVLAALAPLGRTHLELLAHEDPTDLTLLWRDRERVIVVDAVRSGAPPGTIVCVDIGVDGGVDGAPPLPLGPHAGTHDFGLAAAVALSRALGTLPRRLTIIGVEGTRFGVGEPMSAEVAAAVPEVVETVLRLARTEVAA